MKDCPKFHIKKRTLLAVAGLVWLAAGFNVARLGVLSCQRLETITFIDAFLSVSIFCIFGFMFYKMSMKHAKRIKGYPQETKPIWYFFDLKSYCIMAVMMGGGVWLRGSGLVPDVLIAIFYTGLGCALALAGLAFWWMFFRYLPEEQLESFDNAG